MNKEYQNYLNSKEWDDLRSRVHKRATGFCELCTENAEATHHVKYPKNLKDDDRDNLVAVCKQCHDKLHGIKGRDSAWAFHLLRKLQEQIDEVDVAIYLLGDQDEEKLFDEYKKAYLFSELKRFLVKQT